MNPVKKTRMLPATPDAGQPPTVSGDPRNQAFVILILAFLSQWLGKKLVPELVGPVTTVLILVVGAIGAPLYMIYGVMMAKLRNRLQKATQEALIEAANKPEPVDSIVVTDPSVPEKKHFIRLHDLEGEKSE